MDRRWRNLGIIVGAIIGIALLLYLPAFLAPLVTFETGKEHILRLWEENGVLFGDSGPVEVGELNALKAGLQDYKRQIASTGIPDRDALLGYLGIHIKTVEGMLLYRQMDNDYALFLQLGDGDEEICSNIGLFTSLAEKTTALAELAAELEETKQEFAASYPELASEAEPGADIPSIGSEDIGQDIAELDALCRSEGYI